MTLDPTRPTAHEEVGAERLHGRLGTGSAVPMVIAAAAPLTVVGGNVPLAVAGGNGVGGPSASSR